MKGIDSGQWVSEGEGVRSGRGGRRWKYYCNITAPLFGFLMWRLDSRNHMAGKKEIFPGVSGKYPGRGGKKTEKNGQSMWALW